MRIKRVIEADFRWSDLGIWTKFLSNHAGSLKKDDVVVFVSKKGNQLLFIHGFETLESAAHRTMDMLPSVRYRIVRGTWSPYMLANYAHDAGIPIEGLRFFEEHFGHLVEGTEKNSR